MTEPKNASQYQMKGSGASSRSQREGGITGNSVTRDQDERGDTLGARNAQEASTLPSFYFTDPAILASQIDDLLAIARRAGWFVFMLPVSGEGITAISITINIPEHRIGIDGNAHLVIDGLPVKEAVEKLLNK